MRTNNRCHALYSSRDETGEAFVVRGILFKVLLCALVGTAQAGAPRAECTKADFVGDWRGFVEKDGDRVDVEISLSTEGDQLTGRSTVRDVGLLDVQILRAELTPSGVKLLLPLPLGALDLRSTGKCSLAAGTANYISMVKREWLSKGEGRFALKRTALLRRPYSEEVLEGMFVHPTKRGPWPVVVYLSGSGGALREDGAFLADTFARSGIATFSYDKRGAGKSGGDWRTGGYETLAMDAKAALQMLIRRQDVDAARSGFWCHSEGCYVAPVALGVGAPAKFLIAVSGPAVDPDDEELDHFREVFHQAGLPEEEFSRVARLLELDQQVSRGEARFEDFETEYEKMKALPWFNILDWPVRPPGTPERIWHSLILAHHVKPYLDALHVPSLWIYGSKDFIIPVEASMEAVEASSATPAPRIVLFDDADHGMTTIPNEGLPHLAKGYVRKSLRWMNTATREP